MSRYHWRDGWFFVRLADGSVQVSYKQFGDEEAIKMVIPPNEWASVVSSVSAASERAETYDLAAKLHDGALSTGDGNG